LLRSCSDPVKVPPPEERRVDVGCPADSAVLPGLVEPPALPLPDGPDSVAYSADARFPAHLLRAPPLSVRPDAPPRPPEPGLGRHPAPGSGFPVAGRGATAAVHAEGENSWSRIENGSP